MRIDVVPTWQLVNPEQIRDKLAVVIDVLRAATTIVTALANGCRAVYPAATIEEARMLAAGFAREEVILAGERNAVPIPGFLHGNSPLEYPRKVVANRVLILTTTNGTRALRQCLPAAAVVVMALVNTGAVARYTVRQQRDLVIVCAGTRGELSYEDTIAAGALLHSLEKAGLEPELNDLAFAALDLYQVNHTRLATAFSRSVNGRNLIRLQRCRDIRFCASPDLFDLVPVFTGTGVVPLETLN